MEAQAPSRKLTTHQQAVLIQVLLTFPDQQVGVCFSPTATDAFAYAQDFLTIFNTIGWTVKDAEPAEIVTGQSADLALMVGRGGSGRPS